MIGMQRLTSLQRCVETVLADDIPTDSGLHGLRNQDDKASQGDHRATFSSGMGAAQAAGLLATRSDDAHAIGHQRDPTHNGEHG